MQMQRREKVSSSRISTAIVLVYVLVLGAASLHAADPRENWENLKAELAELSGQEYQPASSDHADKCGTAVILQAQAARAQYGNILRRESSEIAARPVLPLFYDTPSGYFRIHYAVTGADAVYEANIDTHAALRVGAADGYPDFINDVGDIFDSIMVRLLTDSADGGLDYPTPPTDVFTTADTDPHYDVFLQDVGGSYFGFTQPERSISGYYGFGWSASSIIVMDNDYQEKSFQSTEALTGISYGDTPLAAIRVTAAHEFFHAIHFGIEVSEAPLLSGFPMPYWHEMSSVAMEELLYDEINDYYAYLNTAMNTSPFKTPNRSLQTFSPTAPDADFPYAMGIFGMYLNEKFGPHFMRHVWEGCGAVGPDFLFALDSALQSHTDSVYNLNNAYAEFGIRLFFTGERAYMAPDTLRFAEAEFYPMIVDTINDTNHFPVNYLTLGSTPNEPESNSLNFAFFKDIYLAKSVGIYPGDCFKVIADVRDSITLFNGVRTHLTLIGVPRDPLAVAFVGTALDSDSLGYDSVHIATGAELAQLLPALRDTYPCFVESIDTIAQDIAGDSVRIRYFDNRPGVYLSTPFDFDQAVFLVTKTSTNFNNYRDYSTNTPPWEYKFLYNTRESTDSSIVTRSEQPYSLLAAYPNPVGPEQQSVTLAASRGALEFPLGEVTIALTIFTEAGEKVFFGKESDSFDLLRFSWDLTNMSGDPVASGVYLVLEQIISTSGEVAQSSMTKVLVVR